MRIGIGSSKIHLTRKIRTLIENQVAARLASFADAIVTATVELSDRNGRRGGGDKRCRVQLVLAGGETLRTQDQRPRVENAVLRAMARAESALRRYLRRR